MKDSSTSSQAAAEIIAAFGRGFEPEPLLTVSEWAGTEYLEQFTAERAIRKYVNGRGSIKQWVKLRSRNDAPDQTVYCLAALHILDNSHGGARIKALPEGRRRWRCPLPRYLHRRLGRCSGGSG